MNAVLMLLHLSLPKTRFVRSKIFLDTAAIPRRAAASV